MKRSVLLLGTALLAFSCAPKPTTVSGTKTNTSEKLVQGKIIYDNNCASCHKLPAPENFTDEKWAAVLKSHRNLTGLSEEMNQLWYEYAISKN